MNSNDNRQKGAVSLFVVIFTSLLFVAVTVGFTVLMLSDQNQSTDNDLAQSALDSANAGTEDAKRVLAQYSDCIERGVITGTETESDGSQCGRIAAAINRGSCNIVNAAIGDSNTDEERVISQSEGDRSLHQAYTCVKVSPDTDSFIGKIRDEGDVRVVPLKTDGKQFSTVRISWLSEKDFDTTSDIDLSAIDYNLENNTGLSDSAAGKEYAPYIGLPSKEQWAEDNRGAILRVGAIAYQPNGAVTVDSLDRQSRSVMLNSTNLSGSSAPGTSGNPIVMSEFDRHRVVGDNGETADKGEQQLYLEPQQVNSPASVSCNVNSDSGYMCTTHLRLANGADNFNPDHLYYMTVASLYRNASFKIELLDDSGNNVMFRNVQPEIDATGRANDVFRRVVSRVESSDASESPYPRAAVGSKSSVCKSFIITDDPDDYRYEHPEDECPDLTRG